MASQPQEIGNLPFHTEESPPFQWIRNLGTCRDGTILVASVNGLFRVKDGDYERLGMEDGLPANEVLWPAR